MKYLSLALIVVAMAASWHMVHSTSSITEYVHTGIQDDLKRIITEQIEQRIPNTHDIQFEKMWTETMKDDQVKASFIYSFIEDDQVEGSTRVEIEGFAILNKKSLQDTDDSEVWSLDQLSILDNVIQFDQGITIRAQDGVPGAAEISEQPVSDEKAKPKKK